MLHFNYYIRGIMCLMSLGRHLQVAYYFSIIIKLYFASFVRFSCACFDVEFLIFILQSGYNTRTSNLKNAHFYF